MGMVVRTNTMALNAYRQLGMNNSAVSKSLEKLSSGFRINRAGDDAAGLAISEKMKAQIKGLETASANAQDGISLIQTAEGNLNEVHDMLNRLVELSTKSANGTYTSTERDALQDEVDALLDEIDRISQSANFNGTKLLDGSLAATQDATKVKIEGVSATASEATKSTFTQHSAFGTGGTWAPTAANVMAGDTISYTVATDDGNSYTVKLSWANDDKGDLKKLVNEKGETVYTAGTAGTITDAQLASLINTELNKTDLANKFDIALDGTTKLKFTSKEAGSKDVIAALGYEFTEGGIPFSKFDTNGALEVDADAVFALTDGYEIKADDITEYNGKNYKDAVFTINGHKFVLLTEGHDGSKLNSTTKNDIDMHATYGLGEDVTILVGGTDGLKNATASEENFKQNIAKIAEVTGLKVTDALDESDYGGTDNAVGPGDGIRLSAGKASTGGLTLQIGDTAEDFNKMRVSIDDMSAKGLKIDGLDITSEESASKAIDKIKNAINTVSTARAGMGALQNRLEHTINNLDVAVENLSAANSRIRDTDMAKEMMNYTKMNVLVQSAQAMLAQANQQPQSVLQLLQ